MIPREFCSLRARLAVLGFFALMVTTLIVLAFLMATEQITINYTEGSLHPDIEEQSRLSPIFSLFAFLIAAPVAWIAWWWAGRAVNPINEISRLTQQIQGGSLNQRLELAGASTELQNLADNFNQMLDRLAMQSRIQHQLIEDISHDLRTPLAILATNSDVTLANASADMSDYRDSIELTSRTVLRLRSTIEELLTNARFNSYLTEQNQNDLTMIVHREIDEFREIASSKEVVLEARVPPQLFCAIEGLSVTRALRNLIDNAIQFSPHNGKVVIEAGTRETKAFLSITDQGPGIPPEHQAHMFERYWSCNKDSPLNRGIGLAIVRQVADAHKGLSVSSPVADGGGTRITLWFQASIQG
jgi:signal transduction histidine kinase